LCRAPECGSTFTVVVVVVAAVVVCGGGDIAGERASVNDGRAAGLPGGRA